MTGRTAVHSTEARRRQPLEESLTVDVIARGIVLRISEDP